MQPTSNTWPIVWPKLFGTTYLVIEFESSMKFDSTISRCSSEIYVCFYQARQHDCTTDQEQLSSQPSTDHPYFKST
uniref:Ovule protein n=1 Tax=Steinernema glaseri TaxID=37863 RepID=A0A1I7YC74_9BILA